MRLPFRAALLGQVVAEVALTLRLEHERGLGEGRGVGEDEKDGWCSKGKGKDSKGGVFVSPIFMNVKECQKSKEVRVVD